jgi:hypothetical protein
MAATPGQQGVPSAAQPRRALIGPCRALARAAKAKTPETHDYSSVYPELGSFRQNANPALVSINPTALTIDPRPITVGD